MTMMEDRDSGKPFEKDSSIDIPTLRSLSHHNHSGHSSYSSHSRRSSIFRHSSHSRYQLRERPQPLHKLIHKSSCTKPCHRRTTYTQLCMVLVLCVGLARSAARTTHEYPLHSVIHESTHEYSPSPTVDVVSGRQGDDVKVCATTQCGADRRCVVRAGAPVCACSPKCFLKNKSAVCGSDGRTYRSECHLLKRACRKKRRLLVRHYGTCQTCSGVKCRPGKSCVLGEDLVPRCRRCPPQCQTRAPRRPVCGADGQTYVSSCHLKTAACHSGRVIVRAYRGACQGLMNGSCQQYLDQGDAVE
ncbi:agrin [Hyalella azteca]|uniref:Agrin n=1 Tax=Hyalella azteca TaxID=294128 RepID=A0A979FSC6_HYAAZ|nr:agrin [Hyalella azteca]